MFNNKKLIHIPLIFLVALIIWIVYSINQPGKWETNFTSEKNSPKGYWNGKIYSRHDEDIKIQKASLIKKGTVIHEWDGNEIVEKNQPFEYLTTTKTLTNKTGRYVLNITWKDTDGTQQEDTITLSPKQRYFVLPNFLN